MTREPADVAVPAARLAKAFPSLSAYSAASLADDLCRIERAQRRHAARCCSGEDGGYVRKRDFAKVAVFDGKEPRGTTEWRKDPATGRFVVEYDPEAEERAAKCIDKAIMRWRDRLRAELRSLAVKLQGDPRGAVLLVRLPGESEAKAV